MNKDILKAIINYTYYGDVKTRDLKPIYDGAQSFYKKAVVKTFTSDFIRYDLLYSYNTLVCVSVLKDCKSYYFLNHDVIERYLYSQTTLRHIKEFLHQYNLDFYKAESITKKDIINNESEDLK